MGWKSNSDVWEAQMGWISDSYIYNNVILRWRSER